MADSLNTKLAMANAFKELMKEKPVEKISIGEICELCEMNRKSFYYHFQDKYDLINWIFDTEFLAQASTKKYRNKWDGIEELCRYLYENKSFYKKALKLDDMNSFSNHLKTIIQPLLRIRLQEITESNTVTDFQLSFYTDAFIYTIYRWLSDPKCLRYDLFLEELKSCVYIGVMDAIKEFSDQ